MKVRGVFSVGIILEEVPNESVKLKTAYGEIFVIKWSEISKISKEEKEVPVAESVAVIDNAPRGMSDVKLESWYTYWGYTNWVNNRYSGVTKELVDTHSTNSNKGIAGGWDFGGVYFPWKESTLVGVVYNQTFESHGNLDIGNSLFAVSIMHFLTDKIGKGPFVRSDVGPSRHTRRLTTYSYSDFTPYIPIPTSSTSSTFKESEDGIGILLGAGLGVPVTRESRLLLTASVAFRISINVTTSLGITIGGLF